MERGRNFDALSSIYSPAVIAEITHLDEVFEAAATVGGGKWLLSRSRPSRREETRRDERNETDNDFKHTGSQPRRAVNARNVKCFIREKRWPRRLAKYRKRKYPAEVGGKSIPLAARLNSAL